MALSTKTKLGIGGSILMLGLAVYLVYAYRKNMFPFTPAFKAKIQSMIGGAAPVPPPPVPPSTLTGTVTGQLGPGATDALTPAAGTGAVPLGAANLSAYDIKGDPTVNTVYQQELYKQLFLPYDQYPYLYDENYRQSLTKPQDPNAPFDPASLVYGYRPPIQGGDVPPELTATTGGQQQLLDYLAQNYGLFPPGGGATPYDTQYFTPGQGQGLPSNMSCMNDASGVLFCQSPSQTSINCKQIMGYWFCPMNAPITDPTTTTPAQPPSANQLCFDYQNNTYCESATQTGQDCMHIDNKWYCPARPVPQGGTGVTPNCFVQQGFTYCESPSQTSINCQQLAGKWYCPTATGSTDCFTDSTGKHYCVSLTPSDPACMSVSGKWYCPDTPTPAATIPTEEDSTKPPPGDPCFNSGGVPYCYSTVKTRDDCMSVAGYWYCPYTVGGGPVTPQTGITPDCPSGYHYDTQFKVCVQNTTAPSTAPGTLPSGYQNPNCAPQYCGSGGQWDYSLCRCVPVQTPSTTPNPTPQPTPTPNYCQPLDCGPTGDWDFTNCRCIARATSPSTTPPPAGTTTTPPPTTTGGGVVITATPYPDTTPTTTVPPPAGTGTTPPSTVPTTTPPPTTTNPPVVTPAPTTCSSSKCSSKYNGSCGTECSNPNSTLCHDCQNTCCTASGQSTCNSSLCSSKYNGSCGSECQNRSSSICQSCIDTCCNYAGSAHIVGQRKAYGAQVIESRHYAANRAKQLRNEAHQENLAARVWNDRPKRPVQASIRSWYTPDVILA